MSEIAASAMRKDGDDRPLPSWGTVFRRQLAVIGWRRGWLPVVAMLPLLAIMEVSRRRRMADWEDALPRMSENARALYEGRLWQVQEPALFQIVPFVGLVAAVWAFVVWHGEAGDRRRHHLALPAPGHDVHRVFAGALYLLGGLALVALAGFALSWTEGSWTYWTTGGSRFSRAPTLFWTHWFTWPLAAYFAASVFPMVTSRPVEWILGTAAAVLVGRAFLEVVPLLDPLAFRVDEATFWIPVWVQGTIPIRFQTAGDLVLLGIGLPALGFAVVTLAARRRA